VYWQKYDARPKEPQAVDMTLDSRDEKEDEEEEEKENPSQTRDRTKKCCLPMMRN
jgi:hypothetical protein